MGWQPCQSPSTTVLPAELQLNIEMKNMLKRLCTLGIAGAESCGIAGDLTISMMPIRSSREMSIFCLLLVQTQDWAALLELTANLT